MKKLLTLILIIASFYGNAQIVGMSGTQTFVRKVSVNDGTKDSIFAMQSDRQFTTVHRYDEYGSNAKGIFLYGSLAGSSIDGTTEGLLALGHNAARVNVAGYGVYLGYQSGYNATGFGNIFIGGYRPGFNQTSSSKGLILGYNIDLVSATADGQMNIMSAIWGTNVNDVTGSAVSAGNVGFFVSTPTARVHLPASTATAGTGSLKFTTGTPTTTPEIGLMQFQTGWWLIDSSNSVRDTIAGRRWVRQNITSGGSGTSNVDNLTTNTTDVGNVTTGLDDLMTYSVPAGQLATNGDYIEFEMTFTFAANSNAKEVKVVYGATTIYATSSQVQNGGTLVIEGRVVRTGAATQDVLVKVTTGATLFPDFAQWTTTTETLSGAVTIKGQAECVATNDCIQRINIVKYWPN